MIITCVFLRMFVAEVNNPIKLVVSLFSIESPSCFAYGALEVIDSGLGKAMAEVVWINVINKSTTKCLQKSRKGV